MKIKLLTYPFNLKLLRPLIALLLIVNTFASGQTTLYTGNFSNSTGGTTAYGSRTITLASQTWLASSCYASGGEFRLGSNGSVTVPTKFFSTSTTGSSIEMQWNVENAKTVSFTNAGSIGTMTNWYIFESTDSGTTWTQVANASYSNNSTLTYTATTPKASARYALIVTGTTARAVLTTVDIKTAAEPATHIAFTTSSTSTAVGSFNTYVVTARGSSNLTDTSYTGNVTLSKVSGPGTVGGTLSKAATSGVATFNNVTFSAAGTYILQAVSGSFPTIQTSNITVTTAVIYTKISAVTDLTDGEYVIVGNGTHALTNTVTSPGITATSVTVASNQITNPSASIVWTITTVGGNKTIFNSNSNSYVSGGGGNTALSLSASGSSTSQQWTPSIVNNLFRFTNAAQISRGLIFRTTPVFAQYATSNIENNPTEYYDLAIYKKSQSTFTVTFNANGGSGTMANQTASVPTNLTANTFTRAGYTFTGWNTAASGSGTAYANQASYSFSADATLYAQWLLDCTAPTLSSDLSVSGITVNSANISGSITSIGGSNVNEEGFEYGSVNETPLANKASTTGLSVSTVPHTITKTISGLQPNTQYYYRAYAKNGCASTPTGYSVHTNGFPYFTTVSLAPVSKAADNVLTNSFRANWEAPSGQGSASYLYYLQISDKLDFSTLIYENQSSADLSYTQNSLAPNTTYYYRVAAKNGGGQSEWSNVITVTTSASNKPVVTASSFSGRVNAAFAQNISATNLPDSYAVVAGSSLPSGLSLNATTGAITGTPTAAGTFTTNVTATKGADVSDPATLTFTIAKGNQTITGLPATRTEVYGVSPYTLSAVSPSGLNVAYTSSNTAVATVEGNTVTVKGVGTTVITARQEGDANWNAATEVTQELTVSTKELTIAGLAPADKVYDQTTAAEVGGTPQYVGLANGESFAVTGTVTWAFADKNVGTNKALVRTGVYNAPSANYNIIQPALTANITKRDITLTSINAVNKVYNASPVADFANVASTQVLSGDQVTFEVLGTFSDANAGLNKAVTVSAVNTAGTDGGNYLVPVFPTGLTADITKANQTITISNLPTTINIGTPINLSSFALSTGGLPLTYTSSIPAIASISGTELSGNNPGSTIITFSQSGNNNYNAAASVERSIDVLNVPVAIAQWDFTGLSTSANATTVLAQNINSSIKSGSAILTRGAGANWITGTNSFRTGGFSNDGISTNNTDYFQTSLTSNTEIMSVTSINANIYASNGFIGTAGANVQFAYSLNGIDYQLINIPVTISTFATNGQRKLFNTSNVSQLQNVPPNTTIYFRFYATGQNTSGTLGFISAPSPENIGLEFLGTFKPSQITWDGNDWSNYNGPVASQNVVIDGPYNKAQGFEANNVTITEDGLLTIRSQQDVTVNGSITLPSDNKILIENDGNLIQTAAGTDTNPTNYEITAKRVSNLPKQGYTYWSSPLSGQNLYSFSEGYNPANGGTGTGTPWNRFYVYNEASDYFVTSIPNEITLSSTSTFEIGRGYAIRGMERFGDVFTDNEFSFNGKINNGQLFSPALKNSCNVENACDKGYNLIGNPYPSSLDFDALYAANSDRMFATAYFWTNSDTKVLQQSGSNYEGNNYAVYNLSGGTQPVEIDQNTENYKKAPNGIVKLGQGFIIKAKVAGKGQRVEFNNSMRRGYDAGAEFYSKKKSEDRNRFWLTMTSPNNIANTILLAYTPEATNDFEMNYDGEYLVIGSDAFYSTLGSRKLAIQGRAAFTDADQVALGNVYSKDGVYKISIRDKEGIFNAGQIIYLKDKLLNKTVNLSQEDYSFTATKGTDETRFEVVYRQAVLGTDTVTKSDFQVYRDGTAYVVSSSKKLGRVEIYDTAGRLMKTVNVNDTSVRIDTSAFVNGVYIIKAENSGDVKTKKIIK